MSAKFLITEISNDFTTIMAKKSFTFSCLCDFPKAFPNNERCIMFLEQMLWPTGPISPYDPTSKVYVMKSRKYWYKCKNTEKNFNVKVGTIFENTKIPLTKWFIAIYLIVTSPKGISATKIEKHVKVSGKTALFLLHRIRECFDIVHDKLTGDVEFDETFVGGHNNRRQWANKCPLSGGRSPIDKKPVFGMLQRDPNGGGKRVICQVVPDTSDDTLYPIAIEHVDLSVTPYFDSWNGYTTIKKIFKNAKSVDHSSGRYVDGDAYTNNIEGFWGNYCKRSIYGCYNWISGAHMQRYFNEYSYRYNHKKDSDFDKFIQFFENIRKRLTYKKLVTEYRDRNLPLIYETAAEQQARKKTQRLAKLQKQATGIDPNVWSLSSTQNLTPFYTTPTQQS